MCVFSQTRGFGLQKEQRRSADVRQIVVSACCPSSRGHTQGTNALRSCPWLVYPSALPRWEVRSSGYLRSSRKPDPVFLIFTSSCLHGRSTRTALRGERLPLKGGFLSNMATQYLHALPAGTFETAAATLESLEWDFLRSQPVTGGGSSGTADKAILLSE